MSKLPFFGTFLKISSETSLSLMCTSLKFQLDALSKMHISSCLLFDNPRFRIFNPWTFFNNLDLKFQGFKKYAKNLPSITREVFHVFFTKELGQILENGIAVKRDELLPTNLQKVKDVAH